MAFEEGAGVLEVLFGVGVGFGGGDALKRFVEDADDPPLLGERGDGDRNRVERLLIQLWLCRSRDVVVEWNALKE